MKNKLILLCLLLLTVGMVSASSNWNFGGTIGSGGAGGTAGAGGTTGPTASTGVASFPLPENFSAGSQITQLEVLGYSDAESCISYPDNQGKYELKCLDENGNEISGLTHTECLSQGSYHDESGIIPDGALPSLPQSPEYYCYADLPTEPFPSAGSHSILIPDTWSSIGSWTSIQTQKTYSPIIKSESSLNDCNLEGSMDRIATLDASSAPMGQMKLAVVESDFFSDEPMCIVRTVQGSVAQHQQYYITDNFFDTQLNYAMEPFIQSIRETNGEPYQAFSDFDYKEKCNYLSDQWNQIGGEVARTGNFLLVLNNFNNQNPVNPQKFDMGNHPSSYDWISIFIDPHQNPTNIIGIDYETFTTIPYEKHEINFETTNEIQTECHENPIELSLDIYLKDYPDLTFEEGIWPVNTPLILDASETTPQEVTYFWTGHLTNGGAPMSLMAHDSKIEIMPSAGDYNLHLDLDITSSNFHFGKDIDLTFEDFFYTDIQTSLSGTAVTPGNPFTFVISGFTFDGVELESFTFDPGQREIGNGQFIDVVGEFQCKESTSVQCLIDDAVYEGVPRIGNACGCPVDLNGAGTIYLGEKEGSKDDNAYKRKFDGDEFEYSFSMQYPTKTSCGPDRVCQTVLEITDVNGRTSEKIIELTLPGVQTCEGVYTNSILGSNSTQFVGDINDGEQSCQCKFGYSPVLDDTLSIALGNPTKTCIQDIIEINETEAVLPTLPSSGQSNPTWDNNRNGNSNGNSNGLSKEGGERDSSGLTIFLILILVALAGIFGFEFYRKKKTGMFFNPFKKSPTSATGPSESISQSPIEKFISDAKKSGEDPATIKQNLMNSGWPENEINKYI